MHVCVCVSSINSPEKHKYDQTITKGANRKYNHIKNCHCPVIGFSGRIKFQPKWINAGN